MTWDKVYIDGPLTVSIESDIKLLSVLDTSLLLDILPQQSMIIISLMKACIVIQFWNSSCGDVVLDSVNLASRDEDNTLD